jgi:hypothetical protein
MRVRCEHCGAVNLECDAQKVTKHHGKGDIVHYFCNDTCANEFYLEALRSIGL